MDSEIKSCGKIKILVLNGPNINMLGKREPKLYGCSTYEDLMDLCEETCEAFGAEFMGFQSNYEGALVDEIQQAEENGFDGIVINAAAYSHTSIAILDALKILTIPAVEVHITEPAQREEFRHTDLTAVGCRKRIAGHGLSGYKEAIEWLITKELQR